MDDQAHRNEILNLRFMGSLPSGLRDQLADIFLEISQNARLGQMTVMFTEGESGSDTGYILLSGEVEVRKSTSPPLVCQVPELLGEMMQFNPSKKRTATVETLGEVQALRFSWSKFQETCERYLSSSDQEKVHQTLESYAWEHFTGF